MILVDEVAVAVTPVGVSGFASVTATEQVAVFPPSAVVTVIVADPAPTAIIVPPDTDATLLLLLLHVKFWFVALEGANTASRLSVPPTLRLIDVLFRETPVTGTLWEATVTLQVAVFPPSTVVTVIVADPAATAVTLPLVDTVATLVLPLRHVTFWLLAFDGVIVASRVSVPPTRMLVDVFKETPVTATPEGPLGVLGLLGVPSPPPLPKPESQAAIEKLITASRAITQSILFCVLKSLNAFFIQALLK
jgi:hypothetical protein